MANYQQYPFFIRLSINLLAFSLIGGIIYISSDIIVPLAFSILLAVLLLPVNRWLERKAVPRVMAIMLSLIVAIILIGLIIYFMSAQVAAFMGDLPLIKEHLAGHFHTIQNWVHDQFHLSMRQQTTFIDNAATKIKNSGGGFVGETFLSVTQAIMVMVLLPVYTFLVLYYRDMIRKFLVSVFKNEHEEKVVEVLKESRSIVQSYMTGLIIEMGIVATINSLGFLLVGIHYAVFLGVLAAILNMIPYIGMLIASVFCMLVTLTNSTEMSDIIWVFVILTVVQFIDNNIIMPKVVSSKVKINALVTILGVFVGGALAGVSGMFLSIPSIAILKVIFDRVDELKPWGILLGDEVRVVKKGKIYRGLKKLSTPQNKKTTPVVKIS